MFSLCVSIKSKLMRSSETAILPVVDVLLRVTARACRCCQLSDVCFIEREYCGECSQQALVAGGNERLGGTARQGSLVNFPNNHSVHENHYKHLPSIILDYTDIEAIWMLDILGISSWLYNYVPFLILLLTRLRNTPVRCTPMKRMRCTLQQNA